MLSTKQVVDSRPMKVQTPGRGCGLQACQQACGGLFSLMGPPRSLESVEALYAAQGVSGKQLPTMSVPNCLD